MSQPGGRWSTVHGALCGLVLFGMVSHVLLLAGLRVAPFWFLGSLALGIATARPWRRRSHARSADAPREPASSTPEVRVPALVVPVSVVLLVLVVGVLVFGSVATPPRQWDGANSWHLRTLALAAEPTLDQPFFRESAVFAHTKEYPLLQPLILASLGRFVGDDAARSVFPLLYVLMLALFAQSLRWNGVERSMTALLTVAFGLTPMLVSTPLGSVDSGFGELFLAFAMTSIAAGLLREDIALCAFGAFLMPLIKPEGACYPLLAAVVLWTVGPRAQLAAVLGGWGVAVALWLPLHERMLGHDDAVLLPTWAVTGGVFAVALLTRTWLDRWRPPLAVPVLGLALVSAGLLVTLWASSDSIDAHGGSMSVYLSGISRAFDRLPELPRLLLGYAEHVVWVRRFGLTFVVLIVLCVLPARRVGRCPSRTLAAFLVAGAGFLLLPFLLSAEPDLVYHLRSSMDRLMCHWLGAAWLLAGIWISRAVALEAQAVVSTRSAEPQLEDASEPE